MSNRDLSIRLLTDKRRLLWQEKNDLSLDEKYINYCAEEILKSENLRNEIISKPYLLIELTFYIVDKKRKTVPFLFNDVQKDFIQKFEAKGTDKPFFILKGRQQGFTSLISAMQLSFAIIRKNFSGFTIADKQDNTKAIFNDKVKTVYDRLPEVLKPKEKFNNSLELFFSKLNSSWRISTASEQVGRSRTLNFVHFSEIAFYDCPISSLQKSIGEALTEDSVKIYETTANGFNDAKKLWDSNTCVNIFYEWWKTKEYQSTEYKYLDTQDTFLKNRIIALKEKGLSKEQITWYAKKYSSYLDKSSIRQEYPCTPEEAFISTGDSMFDVELINDRLIKLSDEKPFKKGYFVYDKVLEPIKNGKGETVSVNYKIQNVRFKESEDGYITLHKCVQKNENPSTGQITYAPYVIGGDTAGSGKDYFTAKVINNVTKETVATLRKQRIDEDIYAEQVYCLGRYYNDALIGIETNYSSLPMLLLQNKYEYPNLYYREKVNLEDSEKVLGFETTSRTKPIIINGLISDFRDNPNMENDEETLKEMSTFVKKENGKTEALNGYHDDLVMALAIAHFISPSEEISYKERSVEEDFLSDFNINKTAHNNGYMVW